MPRRTLSLSLGLCGLLAGWPVLVWLLSLAFSDGTWIDTPLWLAFTIPTGLAVAAIVLVVHGLRLNAELREDAIEEMESLAEQAATVGATARVDGNGDGAAAASDTAEVAATGDATVTAAPRTARTARAERPKASKGKRASQRAKAIARRKIRRSFRF